MQNQQVLHTERAVHALPAPCALPANVNELQLVGE